MGLTAMMVAGWWRLCARSVAPCSCDATMERIFLHQSRAQQIIDGPSLHQGDPLAPRENTLCGLSSWEVNLSASMIPSCDVPYQPPLASPDECAGAHGQPKRAFFCSGRSGDRILLVQTCAGVAACQGHGGRWRGQVLSGAARAIDGINHPGHRGCGIHRVAPCRGAPYRRAPRHRPRLLH